MARGETTAVVGRAALHPAARADRSRCEGRRLVSKPAPPAGILGWRSSGRAAVEFSPGCRKRVAAPGHSKGRARVRRAPDASAHQGSRAAAAAAQRHRATGIARVWVLLRGSILPVPQPARLRRIHLYEAFGISISNQMTDLLAA